MKKFIFIITFIIFITSCKKDEQEPNNFIPQSNNNAFPGVPSGQIVAVDERMPILTQTQSGNTGSRYWMFISSKAKINGCGQTDELNYLEGYESDTIEIKFETNFTYETRMNGIEMSQGSWEWSNESTKSGIILGTYPEVVFTFTMLNDNEVVYASKQNQSTENCSDITVITYEHLKKSTYIGGDNPPVSLYTQGSGVTDIDGNFYQTIIFPNGYEWMQQNLKTTKYRNGEIIPNITNTSQWENLSTGAWVFYENNSNYEFPYGRLYNAYAATDSRSICPSGWHIPSNNEWQILVDYLGGELIAGGKMKTTGTQHWYSPNEGATNESGFSGHPGGSRFSDGDFMTTMGNQGWWWATNGMYPYATYAWTLQAHTTDVNFDLHSNTFGFSVRCVKN